jgi:hypothetical protein
MEEGEQAFEEESSPAHYCPQLFLTNPIALV